MTTAAMAAFEARAGSALVRRFSNAQADFGQALVVDCVYSDPSLSQDLGALAALSRDPAIDIVAADLGTRVVQRGMPVEVVRSVNGTTTRTRYLTRGEPIAHTEHGTLQIVLERER